MLFPENLVITPASENNLNVFHDNWSDLPNLSVLLIKYIETAPYNSYITK